MPDGVYVVDVEVQRQRYRKYGKRWENVTFLMEKSHVFEVNILDFSDDIYGETEVISTG